MPPTGTDLLHLAETRLSERYDNVLVPKDNPNWHGPWDCAEFVSWLVYQQVGRLYGCLPNTGSPATTEAYSGAWARDANNTTLVRVDEATANVMPGVVLVRTPPVQGLMGHIALTDGNGGTVEAAGRGLGVRRDRVSGRGWDFYVQIPGISYTSTGAVVPSLPLPYLLKLETPNLVSSLVGKVQQALLQAGFDPGPLDNEYGSYTVLAVAAYQASHQLVADGIVGPLTAARLGIVWP